MPRILLLSSVLFTCIFGLLVSQNASAALRAEVNKTSISTNESFQLNVIADDSNLLNNLKLEPLEALFSIVGRSTSQQVQIVNGKVNSSATLTITLFPNQSGKLVIPALTTGSQSTKPITINVTNSTAKAGSNNTNSDAIAEFFLTTDSQEVYTQQQFLITLTLHLKANSFSQGDFANPEAVNMQIQLLGEQRYNQIRGNDTWTTIKRRYAAFPQQSGKLKILPITFQGVTMSSRNSFFPIGKNYQIRSNSLTIDVKPPAYTDAEWLPANNITAHSVLTANQVQQGEAITRTITLNARNQLSELLPEIGLAVISGVQSYLDGSDRSNKVHEQGVDGKITIQQVYIPNQIGSFTIPAQQLSWYNLRNNRRETLSVPASHFKVTASSIAATTPQQLDSNSVQSLVAKPDASRWTGYAVYALAGLLLLSLAGNIWLVKRNPKTSKNDLPLLPDKEGEQFKLLGNAGNNNPKDWMILCNLWLKTIGSPSIHSAQGLYHLIQSHNQKTPRELQDELASWLYKGGSKPAGLKQHLQVIRHAYGYPRANGVYNASLGQST